MTAVGAADAAVVAQRPRVALPGFHFGLAILMSGIVVLGFWPFYAGLFTGGIPAHPISYAHAAVFSGWLVLLLTQTWLVFRRRALRVSNGPARSSRSLAAAAARRNGTRRIRAATRAPALPARTRRVRRRLQPCCADGSRGLARIGRRIITALLPAAA